jgi:hypothetical protein
VMKWGRPAGGKYFHESQKLLGFRTKVAADKSCIPFDIRYFVGAWCDSGPPEQGIID